jgi:hypothetical protein
LISEIPDTQKLEEEIESHKLLGNLSCLLWSQAHAVHANIKKSNKSTKTLKYEFFCFIGVK